MGLLDKLFSSPGDKEVTLPASEFKNIVNRLKELEEENKTLIDERKGLLNTISNYKQVNTLRVDSNYSGADADGVMNVRPIEFLDIVVTGDVSIDADDLKNIIRDRNKYHGSLIKQTMEIKRLTTSVTALDNIIKDIRQSAFIKKTSEPIDLKGISECLLRGSAIDESC